ncbi:hypothetical protein AB2N04_13970 [Nitratireductor sp. GISD-1A_MAKvit]|uniref:hypothetical protein n=1 Tax=Nitratireductor sp. GISD-1A_MAKvit TaxID=3234198 RepID=UPI0034658A7B
MFRIAAIRVRNGFRGPLDSSEWIDIGTYRQLIGQAVARGEAASRMRQVTITVVATYRAQDTLVAARRTFDITRDSAGERLSPRNFTAEQIRSRRQRRVIEQLMRSERLDEHGGAVSSPHLGNRAG